MSHIYAVETNGRISKLTVHSAPVASVTAKRVTLVYRHPAFASRLHLDPASCHFGKADALHAFIEHTGHRIDKALLDIEELNRLRGEAMRMLREIED
jgi:hypothetical protein